MSCHYLGRISSAQGFLMAEQRKREREGGREGELGGVRGKGRKTRNEQVAGSGPGGRGTPKESHSLACSCCLLLLVAAGGEKGRKGKGKGTPAKTARRKKSRQHRDRLVGSGLVWSFFFLLFRKSTPPRKGARGKGKQKKMK